MRKRLSSFIGGCFFLCFAMGAQAAQLPESFADTVDHLMPAVVNISTTQKLKGPQGLNFQFNGMPDSPELGPFKDFFEQFGDRFGGEGGPSEREVTSLGSGFIIDPDGYVVTNSHVVAEADDITVTLHDDTKLKAKLVGRDSKTDLALLKVETSKKLPAVVFGDSESMRVGDWVIAIGNPFGLGSSVSAGIISATSRNINSGPFDDFIQTDAAINRGNSGGPLFNIKGEVVGVNTAIFTPTGGNVGIGFAVPSAMAQPVLGQLREFGRTHRGWLGVKIQQVSEEIADSVGLDRPHGALVLEVSKGSPSEEAKIEAGDVILSFDGREVNEMRSLPRMVAETKIGKKVEVKLWRKGKEKTVSVKLGEMDESETDQAEAAPGGEDIAPDVKSESLLGMSLAPLSDKLRQEFGLAADLKGLLVVQVAPDSEAATRGVYPRDVILQVNQEDVQSVKDIRKALDDAKKEGRKHALLRVNRGGETLFITLPAEVK